MKNKPFNVLHLVFIIKKIEIKIFKIYSMNFVTFHGNQLDRGPNLKFHYPCIVIFFRSYFFIQSTIHQLA